MNKLPSFPQIVIDEVRQGAPSAFKECSYDLLLFSKREADRTKALLSNLNKEHERVIYVDENLKWTFPESKKIALFIDVSCMSRVNMGDVFARLFQWLCQEEDRIIQLNLGYSLSRFSVQSKEVHMKALGAVHSLFVGRTEDTSQSTEIIVALGYEESKAWSAVEYLEVKDPWIFVPNSPEKQFLGEVRKKNKFLLNSTKKEIINYRVLEPVDAFFRLKSLAWGLVKESKVILLPFGPKIFFALSLLLGLLEQKLSVWFVDADDEEHGTSLIASSHSVVFSCKLSKDQTDK